MNAPWAEDPLVVVVLACKGGGYAKVVNGRWIVAKCRRSRCQVAGEHTFHIWDALTGRVTDLDHDPLEPGTPVKGVTHAVR